jgi:hypothetical protein
MTSVWDAAEVAIRELHVLGYDGACFVGGVACALYGNTRTPHVTIYHSISLTWLMMFFLISQDLDILILGTIDDEETIKRRLTARNSSFYLIPSKKIGATYKVLWYDRYRYSYLGITKASSTSIKVDILRPPTMDIPAFEKRYISRVQAPSRLTTLPTAPLSLVLLLKLQAWSQHRTATEYYFSKEQYKDQRDLDCLVPIAAGKGIQPKNDAFLSAQFIEKAEQRIKQFLGVYSESLTRAGWITMGFAVANRTTVTSTRVATTSLFGYRSSGELLAGASTTTTNETMATRKYHVKPLPKVKPLYSYGSSRY